MFLIRYDKIHTSVYWQVTASVELETRSAVGLALVCHYYCFYQSAYGKIPYYRASKGCRPRGVGIFLVTAEGQRTPVGLSSRTVVSVVRYCIRDRILGKVSFFGNLGLLFYTVLYLFIVFYLARIYCTPIVQVLKMVLSKCYLHTSLAHLVTYRTMKVVSGTPRRAGLTLAGLPLAELPLMALPLVGLPHKCSKSG